MQTTTREETKDQGFTLIELLVVVLIIGILAAIAIPVFLSQREKAADASVKSDLKNAATIQETYMVDNQTYADTLDELEADGYDFKSTDSNTIDVVAGNADGFCMSGTAGNDTYYYDSNDGGLLSGAATCIAADYPAATAG